MSIGAEIASGEICRVCCFPLKGEPPGHTRLCPECHRDEECEGGLDAWEQYPAEEDGLGYA